MHLAAISGNKSAIELLLQPGSVDVNALTSSGETPLMKSAANGRIEICQVLLSVGADPKITTAHKMTAIDFA